MTDDTYYMLTAAGDPPSRVTGHGPDGRPQRITADPRTLMLSEALASDHEHALLEHRCQLLCLRPDGPVTEDPGDRGYFGCLAGWTVTAATADLSPVLGPQAGPIMAVIAQAEHAIAAGGCPAWDDYADAADALSGGDTAAAFDAADTAARAALAAVGADAWFWALIGAGAYGPEVLALAARDLTGQVPGWTPAAYKLLTGPWAAAFGAAHPGDAVPAAAAAGS
jgi:hypothetical protein